MRLIPNWRDVLRRAWSIRFVVIAGVLQGVEVALPLIDQVVAIPAGLFAFLSLVAVAAAFVARILAQSNLPET